MGSIVSNIGDDYEEYELLCKEYNETPDELYGTHHKWLLGRNNGTVTITFEQYKRDCDIKTLKTQLVENQLEMLRLERERDEISKKLTKLGF
jgi:chorismate-pyruvate lyase